MMIKTVKEKVPELECPDLFSLTSLRRISFLFLKYSALAEFQN